MSLPDCVFVHLFPHKTVSSLRAGQCLSSSSGPFPGLTPGVVQQVRHSCRSSLTGEKREVRATQESLSCTRVHSCPKVAAAQASVCRWMINTMWCAYNGRPAWKEGHSDTCYNTDKPWGHYAAWKKPVTTGPLLHHPTHMRWQTVAWWVPGPGGAGNGELVSHGDRVAVLEKFWRWMVLMAAQQCEWTQRHWTNGIPKNA